jgi:hypothetical protein
MQHMSKSPMMNKLMTPSATMSACHESGLMMIFGSISQMKALRALQSSNSTFL